MVPIYHHFEKKGWSESTIVIDFDYIFCISDNWISDFGKYVKSQC